MIHHCTGCAAATACGDIGSLPPGRDDPPLPVHSIYSIPNTSGTYRNRSLTLPNDSSSAHSRTALLAACVFVYSGSEANDITWCMRRAWTGGHQGFICQEFAEWFGSPGRHWSRQRRRIETVIDHDVSHTSIGFQSWGLWITTNFKTHLCNSAIKTCRRRRSIHKQPSSWPKTTATPTTV
jgi:hypothetical protein